MRPINDRFLERAGMLEVASDDLYERDPHAILETFLTYETTVGIDEPAFGLELCHDDSTARLLAIGHGHGEWLSGPPVSADGLR